MSIKESIKAGCTRKSLVGPTLYWNLPTKEEKVVRLVVGAVVFGLVYMIAKKFEK